MEIAKYHRSVSLLASAGNVIPRQSDSYAELGRLGQAITQFGLESEQQRLKAEEYDQLTNAENQVDREYDELFNSLDPNDTESWADIIEKKSYDEITKSVTNSKAQAKWGPRLEAKKLRQKRSVLSYRRTIDTRNYQRNYYLNFNNAIEAAGNQELPEDYDQVLIGRIESLQGLRPKEGVVEQIVTGTVEITPENIGSLFESVDDYDNPMFKDYELRINEAKALVKAASEEKKKKFMEDQLEIALSLPEELGYIDKINTDDWPFDLDSDDITDLKRKYQTTKKIREYEDKTQREKREAEVELKARGFAIATPERPADWQAGVDIINASLPELGADWHSQAINKHQNAFRIMNATGKNVYKETQSPTKFGEIRDSVLAGTATEKEIRDNVGPDGYSTTDEAYLIKLFNGDESKAKALEDSAAGKNLTALIDDILFRDDNYLELSQYTNQRGLGFLGDYIKRNPEATGREKKEEALRISRNLEREYESGSLEQELERVFKPYYGLDIKKLEKLDKELTVKTKKEPTQSEFTQNVAALKRQGKTKEAREYYDKWVGKLWQ